MITAKASGKLLGAGVLSAIVASSCCIVPVLALIAGSSGMASSFSWVEPFRPYLIGLSIAVLSFAWYQKLKLNKQGVDCCAIDDKPKFIQSRTFLGIITVFALLMMAFPSYSNIFFANNEKQVSVVDKANIQTTEFRISGMTCTSCEDHVEHAVNKLRGIVEVEASYENENATIVFDSSKTSLLEIKESINSTGYTVVNYNNQKIEK